MICNNNDSNNNDKSSRLYLVYSPGLYFVYSPIGTAVWRAALVCVFVGALHGDGTHSPRLLCGVVSIAVFTGDYRFISGYRGSLHEQYASAGCSCGISLQQTAAFCPDCFGDKAEGKCHLPATASEGLLGATMHPSPPELSGELSKCKVWSCKRSHPEPGGEPQPYGGPWAAQWLPSLPGHALQHGVTPSICSNSYPQGHFLHPHSWLTWSPAAVLSRARRGRRPDWRPSSKPRWLCEVGAVASLGRQRIASDLGMPRRC